MKWPVVDFASLSRASKFRHLCRLVCEAAGLKLGFVDVVTDRRAMLDYQLEPAPLCTYLRGNQSFAARCAACDKRHLERAKSGASPSVYLCHAGLIDMVVPVKVGGRHVGTFMGGQALPQAPTEARFLRFLARIGEVGQYNKAVLRT